MSVTSRPGTVPWTEKDLNLSDFALFLSTMKIKRAYEIVVSTIMGYPVELKQVKVEEVILNRERKRAIRLDAWGEAVDRTQFSVEMQNDTTQDDIRKRSRYYQGMIDTPILKAGKRTKYKKLPPTYIIFITQDDIFGMDHAMYSFRNVCREVPDLELGDGAEKIFLNMSSFNGREDLISLLQYMKRSTLDNPDIPQRGDMLVELDEIVREVKQSEEWEEIEMSIFDIASKAGFEQGEKSGFESGKQQGMQQGMQKGIMALIADNLEEAVPDERIIEKLIRHFDLSRGDAEKYLMEYRKLAQSGVKES
ncbi:MAG: Rpn family recombination-promoting nuclease/putative transposase [Eubacterium sp.]|nr:Rpn family recombination-promoting nuclease/putative transposase [Eubacterium sp.]